MRWSLNELVTALAPSGGNLLLRDDGRQGGDVVVTGVSIDSRSVEAGDLFVPIIAERDGHDFIAAAIAAGAVATLVDGNHADQFSEAGDPAGGAIATIAVEDTSGALLTLGSAARRRLTGVVVGVTGSVGKTSVKDLLTAIGSVSTETHSNRASFNNELGVPLTLLCAPEDAGLVIVEMGARDVGHLRLLCDIAEPSIGVVTAVAAVHTEIFGSIEQVAQAKGELVEALPVTGTAVLNADDPLVVAMASRTAARVMTFGSRDADVSVADLEVGLDLRPRFTLRTPFGTASIRLGVAGAHMAQNAAAAAAAALAAGLPFASVVEGLVAPILSPHRMDLFTTGTGTAVINDAYNANPTSMRAGIDALEALPAQRRVAVLGVMGELGVSEAEDHQGVAAYAVERGIEVIAVNAPLYGEKARHLADIEAAVGELGNLSSTDAVLVKGSRVAGLERFVDAVIARDGLGRGPDPEPARTGDFGRGVAVDG